MKRFFATQQNVGTSVLRIAAGCALLPFGLAKIGFLGGMPFSATVHFFATLGIPMVIALLVTIAETIGAISLILGFCTRFCAGSLVVVMAGAVVAVWKMGYFTGFALPLVFLIVFLTLLIQGGGAWSLDRAIAKKMA